MKKRIMALLMVACLVSGVDEGVAAQAAIMEEDVTLEQAEEMSKEQEEPQENQEKVLPEEQEESLSEGQEKDLSENQKESLSEEQAEEMSEDQDEGIFESQGEAPAKELFTGQSRVVSFSPAAAETIQLDKQYNGSLTESVPVRFYKLTLP